MRFELLGRAAVPPVLGVEVLGLGDVAGERDELDAVASEPAARAPRSSEPTSAAASGAQLSACQDREHGARELHSRASDALGVEVAALLGACPSSGST